MVRVRSTIVAKSRKKKVLKAAKGQFGKRSKNFRQAIKSVIKGLTYEYRDRKVRRREFRSLWIIRINAACQEKGIKYSRFIDGLTKADVTLNRKILAELAISSPEAFGKLVDIAKSKVITDKTKENNV